jgi:hypothetical protein
MIAMTTAVKSLPVFLAMATSNSGGGQDTVVLPRASRAAFD